jgi:hypothetical protein
MMREVPPIEQTREQYKAFRELRAAGEGKDNGLQFTTDGAPPPSSVNTMRNMIQGISAHSVLRPAKRKRVECKEDEKMEEEE